MKKIFQFIICFLFIPNIGFSQNSLGEIYFIEARITQQYATMSHRMMVNDLNLLLSIDTVYTRNNFFRLGIEYLYLAEYENAETAFEKGILKDPGYPFNYAGLSMCQLIQNKANDAKLNSIRALAVYPSYMNRPPFPSTTRQEFYYMPRPIHSNWILHNLGVTYVQLGKTDSAYYYFKKASKNNGGNVDHLIALALLEIQAQNYSKAASILKNAYAADSRNCRINFLQSYLHFLNKDFKAAIKEIDRADVFNVSSGESYFLKSYYFLRSGFPDSARLFLRQAVSDSSWAIRNDLTFNEFSVMEMEKIFIEKDPGKNLLASIQVPYYFHTRDEKSLTTRRYFKIQKKFYLFFLAEPFLNSDKKIPMEFLPEK
jgi:tetratricopeptide (TPR) repeat protein